MSGTYASATHDEHYAGYYHERVEEDVQRYLNRLHRRLDLNQRQERRLYRMLTNRTYDLLRTTRRPQHQQVYPFPRRFDGRQSRAAERWWHDVDRRIEDTLTKRQARIYRQLTGRSHQGRRYYRYKRGG